MASYKYARWTFGQVEALLNILGGEDIARKLLSGAAKVKVEILNNSVDGNADPYLPNEYWKVEEHKKSGEMNLTREGNDLYLDGKKIDFYLSDDQQKDMSIKGDELRKELASKSVLNANVLDYLLRNQHLIPEEWKMDASGNTRSIFFWGSIYRHSGSGDGLCVRGLYFSGGGWFWCNFLLGLDWGGDYPAAVLA